LHAAGPKAPRQVHKGGEPNKRASGFACASVGSVGASEEQQHRTGPQIEWLRMGWHSAYSSVPGGGAGVTRI